MKWLLAFASIWCLACPAWAAQLSKAELHTGVTIVHSTGTVSLGIPAGALSQTHHTTVTLKPVAKPTKYLYTNGDLLSDMYRYTITGDSSLVLNQALWLQMSYPSAKQNTDKILKYWNRSLRKWKPVHHVKDFSDQWYIRGTLQRRNAVIAVFSKPIPATDADSAIVQGIASWYDGTGIACNDFPIGSMVRVTNVATGAYVDDRVVSTGPFVTGRVVDLTRADFSAIASLSAGVVEVTVQLAP